MKFFSRLSIQSKLMLMLLAVSIASILVISYVGYTSGKEAILENIYYQITELRNSRARQVQSYFNYVQNHAITLAEDPTVIEATVSFTDSFNQLENEEVSSNMISELWRFYEKEFIPRLQMNVDGNPTVLSYFPKENIARYLQYHYLVKNPYDVDNKSRLDMAQDGSKYSEIHQNFHKFFRSITTRFDYRNLFLVDSETGNIVYSVHKDTGFATSFKDGPYAYSGAANLFETLQNNRERGAFEVIDFTSFRPSYGQPVAFIGSPIFQQSNLVGILLLQLPVNEINRIMTGNFQWKKDGLGKTGETILVGSDYLMRSQSRFLVENPDTYFKELKKQNISDRIIQRIKENNSPILLQEVKTNSIEKALKGEEGLGILDDYRGVSSLVAYAPLKLSDNLDWVILSKIYVSEAFEPIQIFGKRVLVTSAILVPIVTILSLFLSRRLVMPIYRLISGTKKITSGQSNVVVTVPSDDEFCQLAGAFNKMARTIDEEKEALEEQIRKNDALLLKTLPAPIVKRLKQGEEKIADKFPHVTVLSANIVGFDEQCDLMSAEEAVGLLNDIISAFDDAAQRHDVEKISTVGTSYLAASGLFVPRLDRDKAVIELGLEMLRIVRAFSQEKHLKFEIRIGIYSGEVIGGLLGKQKFIYNLIGNTAKVARFLMIVNSVEGKPNSILISQNLYEPLQEFYQFFKMGEIDIPSQGKMAVWLLSDGSHKK
ncbi:adenylate/guanylate cyclase domain-containing protein [Crocosphaera chwakensis]|uniref:Putative cyclase (Adenylyl-or guanylyl-)(Adenylate-or guanylate-) n=1 Tax=Crocosphaera chwakensis CCY0110 TaxID=391612 RepID=A3IMQ4_9CHRO|nr:adenylate/guanylate cyclase domain-containing protein [Crocosphaera chwakensis]EAZ92157.1 putative cyclase (adenylyl-or guanylyl-)(adenylate-or guanylate-) [Crocosphaera chwakensis CCY0110]